MIYHSEKGKHLLMGPLYSSNVADLIIELADISLIIARTDDVELILSLYAR